MKVASSYCVRIGVFGLLVALSITQLGLFGKKKDAEKIEAQKAEIRKMAEETLEEAYARMPALEKQIRKAEGYGVFSNVGINVIFGSFAGGHGLVVNNGSGEETFMKMGSAGLGLGIGVKDFRGIFVFHSEEALEGLVAKGWDFSAQADAAAKAEEKGGAGETAGTALPGVDLYQFTDTGLALQATIQATRYWRDKQLNE
jgi:lipid-binding SYLF domain-containing protein